jgi:hypothetical protein
MGYWPLDWSIESVNQGAYITINGLMPIKTSNKQHFPALSAIIIKH